jgi:hypothetical protein
MPTSIGIECVGLYGPVFTNRIGAEHFEQAGIPMMSGMIGIRFFAGVADMGTLHVARHPATCMLFLEVAVWSILLSFRETNTTTKRAQGDALPGVRNTQLAQYRGACFRDEGHQSNASTSAIVPAPVPYAQLFKAHAAAYGDGLSHYSEWILAFTGPQSIQ